MSLREVELELLRDRQVDRTQLALRPAHELLERRRDELRLLGEDVVRRVGHALEVELVLLEGVRPADQVGARGDAVLRRESRPTLQGGYMHMRCRAAGAEHRGGRNGTGKGASPVTTAGYSRGACRLDSCTSERADRRVASRDAVLPAEEDRAAARERLGRRLVQREVLVQLAVRAQRADDGGRDGGRLGAGGAQERLERAVAQLADGRVVVRAYSFMRIK